MSQYINRDRICRIIICGAVFSAAGCGATHKARMESIQDYIIGAPIFLLTPNGSARLNHEVKESAENRELRDNYKIWAKARRELNEKEQAAKRSQAQPAPPQDVP